MAPLSAKMVLHPYMPTYIHFRNYIHTLLCVFPLVQNEFFKNSVRRTRMYVGMYGCKPILAERGDLFQHTYIATCPCNVGVYGCDFFGLRGVPCFNIPTLHIYVCNVCMLVCMLINPYMPTYIHFRNYIHTFLHAYVAELRTYMPTCT